MISLLGQDTTKPFYFPHKTCDMWEYLYFEYGTTDVDTIQNFTISNTTDAHGIIHLTQFARRINPIQRPYLLYDTTRYWIDTINNFVWGKISEAGDSLLIYKLNANKGDKWIFIKGGFYGMARVEDKWIDMLFGKETTFMKIHYYVAEDSTDTLGINHLYTDEITDGFGLIYRVFSEYSGEIHLIGAVINNTLFGDTTLVGVKNKRNFLPSRIRLNQNYPNPFNPSTTITFELTEPSNISLIIYDVLGREIIKLLDDKHFNSGEQNAKWNGLKEDGGMASNGIYLYRIIDGTYTSTKKMVILK